MKAKILACRTLEREVRLAMENCGCRWELEVLSDSNHDVPARLRQSIQKKLDDIENADRVLLAFTTCGGAMVGLRSGEFELVIPRMDDCICLLMGSMARRKEVLEGGFGLFVTQGWLENEKNSAAQLEHIRNKYSPARAKKIIETMYGNFDSLNVIDTGAYDLPSILPRTEALARELHLTHRIVPGTLELLENLVQGPYDPQRFIIVPPHTEITERDVLLTPVVFAK